MIYVVGAFWLVAFVVAWTYERIKSEYAKRPRYNEDDEDKKSPSWVFMRRKVIGDFDSIYIDRWIVVRTPLFSVMVHQIFRPDGQRDLHDHPWNFVSLILRGSYDEDTPNGMRTIRWLNFKRLADRHSIRAVSRRPVWTLLLTGRRQRTWGFWVPLPCAICARHAERPSGFASDESCGLHHATTFVPYNLYDKLNQA